MPNIMNAKDYAEYQRSVAEFIAREGISFLSTGTDDITDSERPIDPSTEGRSSDPWFSWSPCECCGCHLGGNREYLYARDEDNNLVQFTICEDCVYYVNYGRLDDTTMMRVETEVL